MSDNERAEYLAHLLREARGRKIKVGDWVTFANGDDVEIGEVVWRNDEPQDRRGQNGFHTTLRIRTHKTANGYAIIERDATWCDRIPTAEEVLGEDYFA